MICCVYFLHSLQPVRCLYVSAGFVNSGPTSSLISLKLDVHKDCVFEMSNFTSFPLLVQCLLTIHVDYNSNYVTCVL